MSDIFNSPEEYGYILNSPLTAVGYGEYRFPRELVCEKGDMLCHRENGDGTITVDLRRDGVIVDSVIATPVRDDGAEERTR